MAYEAEVYEMARRARSDNGVLQEVIFLERDKDSLLVFERGLIRTDRRSILAFGYSGTGPDCYATFLAEFGFRETNVDHVHPPAKLTAAGTWTRGKRHPAQWEVEVEGRTVEEVRSELRKVACVFREDVLADGSQTEIRDVVQAGTDDEALRTVRCRIPPGSTVVASNVQIRETTAEAKKVIVAATLADASALAQTEIKPGEAPYKSLVGVRCIAQPRKGFLGMGEGWGGHPGRFRAKYQMTRREVCLTYRPPARIRALCGPKKLACNECGQPMIMTTEGVHVDYSGGTPNPEAVPLKLRCDRCDITRFEKRYEIMGDWIEWEDGSVTIL